MRRTLWLAAAAAIAIFPAMGRCQQQDQAAKPSQQSSDSQSASSAVQQAPAQQESLADAARRTREQKKDTPKQAKVFTNDNIPTKGGISAVGAEPAAPADGASDDSSSADSGKGGSKGMGEKEWRARFAKLRDKLQQDEAELDVMQRELGVLDVQNYSDPVKAMQQNLTRSDINEKTAKIDAKKAQIEGDRKAISDAEDDLRKAGGDSGWAR
jgi:small-conductance mechanosensitive channel